MTVSARATTSDEGVRDDERQGRTPCTPFSVFHLISSCEFQDSSGSVPIGS